MGASVDGFYAAYLSGKAGQGFALLEFRDGRIVGADATGGLFDGRYAEEADDGYEVTLKITIPPNMQLIQGGVAGPEGDTREQSFRLPLDFFSREFVRVETARGPVNAKVVKLRSLDD